VCSGRASWGYGREAARDAARVIKRAIEASGTLDDIVDVICAASRRARAEFGIAGEDAPAFSVLIALLDDAKVDLAWVGDVDAALMQGSKTVQRIEPHVFADGDARVVTCPLPGERAWELEPFLERATWTRSEGDRFVNG
jgi:hypothetical protein